MKYTHGIGCNFIFIYSLLLYLINGEIDSIREHGYDILRVLFVTLSKDNRFKKKLFYVQAVYATLNLSTS